MALDTASSSDLTVPDRMQESTPIDPQQDVQVVTKLETTRSKGPEGRIVMINHFEKRAMIGKGQHGEVFEGFDIQTSQLVAIKAMRRKDPKADKMKLLRKSNIEKSSHTPITERLSSTENKIRKEVAIMKKCRHANVVRLLEVIDDKLAQKIYLIMENLGGGEIKWRTTGDQPILTVNQTRRMFRDAILGLEYLHHQGIIHRDIKPGNLLWTEDRAMVKISDFGVSHFSQSLRKSETGPNYVAPQDDCTDDPALMDEKELSKRAGTPPFFAPELLFEYVDVALNSPSGGLFSSPRDGHSSSTVHLPAAKTERPPITKAIDVWALGITLYCLLFGHVPFQFGDGKEFAMYVDIANTDWGVEETMGYDQIPTGGRHPNKLNHEGAIIVKILDGMLQKDAKLRSSLGQVKSTPWITRDIPNTSEWLRETSPGKNEMVIVTDVDTESALSSLKYRNAFYKKISHRLSSMFNRPSRSSRSSRSAGHSDDEDKVGTTSVPNMRLSQSRTPRNKEKGKNVDPREKGKSPVEPREKRKERRPKTARNESAPTISTSHRSKSIDSRWHHALSRESLGAIGLGGSGRKSRRGSQTLIMTETGSSVQTPETSSPTSIRSEQQKHSWKGWVPGKSRSRASTPLPSSSTISETAIPVHSNADPFTKFVRNRKSDEFRASIGGAESPLIFAQRASSWGEASDYFEEAMSLSGDEGPVSDDVWLFGAGGVADEPPFGAQSTVGLAAAASAVPLPLRQPAPEHLLINNATPTSPDPAMHDTGYARHTQMRSQTTSPSPLAKLTYSDDSDTDAPPDASDDESMGYGDIITGGRYHGSAYPDSVSVSSQAYDDDEESDEDNIPIEVKRRRPSVAVTSASPSPPRPSEG